MRPCEESSGFFKTSFVILRHLESIIRLSTKVEECLINALALLSRCPALPDWCDEGQNKSQSCKCLQLIEMHRVASRNNGKSIPLARAMQFTSTQGKSAWHLRDFCGGGGRGETRRQTTGCDKCLITKVGAKSKEIHCYNSIIGPFG